MRISRGEKLAFAAPPLIRSGPASEADAARVAAALGVDPEEMLAVEWVDNGPGWITALFESAERVLELRPGALDFDLGAVGFHPPGSPAAIELRAWAPVNGLAVEDPVTGSLNASVAQWLLGSGRLTAPYLAHQGTRDRPRRPHPRLPGPRRHDLDRRRDRDRDRRPSGETAIEADNRFRLRFRGLSRGRRPGG